MDVVSFAGRWEGSHGEGSVREQLSQRFSQPRSDESWQELLLTGGIWEDILEEAAFE